ncbi:MAG: KGK domain-containing protein [Leptolyngbyaceae cyanobacterium SL_7_1]|nr:KGK domain-containing protein [Leptolyngbyaceae cyanobacterium SL_7_1]
MDQEFGLLQDSEVLHITRGRILMSNPTFRVNEFLDALAQLISDQEDEWTEETEGWFNHGLACEVLRLGNQGWQRGRVRIRLEFCPDDKPKLLQESPRIREGRVREDELRDDLRLRDEARRRSPREDVYSRSDEFFQENLESDY